MRRGFPENGKGTENSGFAGRVRRLEGGLRHIGIVKLGLSQLGRIANVNLEAVSWARRKRNAANLLNVGEAERQDGIGQGRFAGRIYHLVLDSRALLGAIVDQNRNIILEDIEIKLWLGLVEQVGKSSNTGGRLFLAQLNRLESSVERLKKGWARGKERTRRTS